MSALGIGLIFLGYSIGFWGYCLIRGYDISLAQMFSKTWPPNPPTGSGGGGTPKAA